MLCTGSVLCAKKRALQRSVLCKEACSAKGACSAKKCAVQRSVLCKEACSDQERAMQRSVLCTGACSAQEHALTRSVLCKGACCAEERALQRSVLCKEVCSAKKRALQRSVLCKGECSAKKRALQRSVLCKLPPFLAEHVENRVKKATSRKKEWQVGRDNDSRSRRPRTAAHGGGWCRRAEPGARTGGPRALARGRAADPRGAAPLLSPASANRPTTTSCCATGRRSSCAPCRAESTG